MAIVPTGFKVRTRPDSPFFFVLFYPGGKRTRITTSVPRDGNREEAEREAAAIVFKVLGQAAGGQCAPVPQAVAEQLDLRRTFAAWLDATEKEARALGRNVRYRSRLETDWIYIGKRFTHPREITSEAWENWKLDLHHSNGGPLKWQSIAHVANTLRHFLRWCAGKGIVAVVPELKAPTMKERKRDRAKKLAMDEAQREAFLWALAILGEARALRIYCTLFQTWQRKRTIANLARSWVDFTAETIALPPQFMKNGEAALIDLTPIAAQAIREELDVREAEMNKDLPASAQPRLLGPDEPIFGRFDFHQAEKAGGGLFGRALALAGIAKPGMTPHHVTRHSSATIAAGKPGATLAGLMAQGAWASAQVVEESYLHPTLEDARRATRSA